MAITPRDETEENAELSRSRTEATVEPVRVIENESERVSAPEPMRDARHESATPSGGLSRVRVVKYAVVDNAHIYRAEMRLFYENRQRYGQHLSPQEVAERLRRTGIPRTLDEVTTDLDYLTNELHALEAQHDSSRARTASELVRRHFVYDITAAGELTERYLEQLDGLVEQAGSLQGTRLPAILSELASIADALAKAEPNPEVLQRALTNLVAALDELHSGANDFTRQLAKVMRATETLDEDAFHAYKSRVLEYLEGFRLDLERFTSPIADAIARVEQQGVDRLVTLIASIEQAPAYNVSEEEARSRLAELRRNQWAGVRNWFVGTPTQPPPYQRLDGHLRDAIGWILRAVQRLKERRSHRVDRSVEYRHLARLFAAADADECHAVYAAAFGLFPPRHFGAPEEDPGLTTVNQSFWDAPVPLIEAHLRNPDRRAPGLGRSAPMVDNTMAREALRIRRERERREFAQVLRRFAGVGAIRLSDLKHLDETEFAHLLGWLGRALEAGTDASGRLHAESSDGSTVIALKAPESLEQTVVLSTPLGRFHTPNYELEVVSS